MFLEEVHKVRKEEEGMNQLEEEDTHQQVVGRILEEAGGNILQLVEDTHQQGEDTHKEMEGIHKVQQVVGNIHMRKVEEDNHKEVDKHPQEVDNNSVIEQDLEQVEEQVRAIVTVQMGW